MRTIPFCYLVGLAGLIASVSPGVAAEPAADAGANLVPHYLLNLIHTPEVHQELKLSDEQVESLEGVLRAVDAVCFPARLLPEDQQRVVRENAESRVWDWFGREASAAQLQRMRQLDLAAVGDRAVLRSDVAKAIGLQPAQRQKLLAQAQKTEELKRLVAETPSGDAQLEERRQSLDKATQAEREELKKTLRPEQWQKLKPLVGDAFDFSQLKRIYPLAPEFVPVDNWVNSSPLTMRGLKGKVVLVHFYAFECHNCHANFDLYQKWHRELADQGVVVVGIQTPETPRERDPQAVRRAALERELKFPILIDLQSDNWKAWGNTMWPTVYVIDKRGYLRMWWQGELRWQGATGDQKVEKLVAELIQED